MYVWKERGSFVFSLFMHPAEAFTFIIHDNECLLRRWTVLVACIWIECFAGASYSFSIYSETIKTRFSYNQQELDTISVFKDIGECVGIISGLLYDRFSPWVVLSVGAAQNLVGYTLMWLMVTHRLPTPAVWEMCLLICVAVNGQTYYNTACIVTSVNNFPANRGFIVGLMKGCLGLSSAILSRFWRAAILGVQDSSGSSFLLVAASVPTAVAFFLMPVVRKIKQNNERKISATVSLMIVSAPVVVLALFFMAATFWDEGHADSSLAELAISILILACPLLAAWRTDRREFITQSSDNEKYDPLLANVESPNPSESENDSKDLSVCRVLCSLDFLLLLFTSAVALGSGFAAVNNLGQVATSLGHPQSDVSIFVSLVSIWQFFGRFGGGAASDYLLSRFGAPRPLLTSAACFILSFGYYLIVTAPFFPWALYVGSVVIGLSFGANWCLNPTTVSELFALSYFGTLYNVVLVGNPVVSYVLSVWVAGYLYDREAEREGKEDCSGSGCFKLTFVILAGVCMLAAFASLLLWARTRRYYAKMRS